MHRNSPLTRFQCSRGLEIKYGGERRSGSYRLMVLCNELIRGDTTTWPDLAVYNPLAPPTGLRAMLIDELTSLLTVHNAVLRGDPALGLSGYLGRDAAMDALMLVSSDHDARDDDDDDAALLSPAQFWS